MSESMSCNKTGCLASPKLPMAIMYTPLNLFPAIYWYSECQFQQGKRLLHIHTWGVYYSKCNKTAICERYS